LAGKYSQKGIFSEKPEVYQFVKVDGSKSESETKIMFVLPQEHTSIEFNKYLNDDFEGKNRCEKGGKI
jgi:hypothetical protein